MNKSDLYEEFSFAVKFVNRERVIYGDYFPSRKIEAEFRTLPFGRTIDDMGPVSNNFQYKHIPLAAGGDTDFGTSRAYRILLDDREYAETPTPIVCVTHESGLEIFLISAATLVGAETTKFALKRVLERIERRINEWIRKKREEHRPPNKKPSDAEAKPIVEKIAIRTPSWEITVDGSFSPVEREKILAYFSAHLIPNAVIENYLSDLDDRVLYDKVKAASKEIIQY